ncbi:Uncharacterised protein [Nocardia otitidiscaviarum]|uniref:Uncharacterized protein n=1 Tax=Nocardia otitidiscaviarum TaxID=1823 RepID=A0A379JH89_9NOCA|nr:hypothetical protein [Nocardia otitidiscaviarum]MCP9619917.1 hypothetical protein [Nocardia otitidiscaviarum]QDP78600.1 hypothetical protein FOH10_07445 [Nocardia otitidiscaviarum]SUD47912.1 Uncharacterised protein [Nocardia otitidiscaviarum]
MIHNESDSRTVDRSFWRWATLALPLAIAFEAALFAAIGSAIVNSDPVADPSRHLLFSIVAAVMVTGAILLFRKGTSASRGTALGTTAACAFLLFFWLVTL